MPKIPSKNYTQQEKQTLKEMKPLIEKINGCTSKDQLESLREEYEALNAKINTIVRLDTSTDFTDLVDNMRINFQTQEKNLPNTAPDLNQQVEEKPVESEQVQKIQVERANKLEEFLKGLNGDFLKKVEALEDKAKNHENKENYTEAARLARRLHTDLLDYYNNFVKRKPLDEQDGNLATFKNNCATSVEKALDEGLGAHRRPILKSIANLLKTLVSKLRFSEENIKKFSRMGPKTDTEERLIILINTITEEPKKEADLQSDNTQTPRN